MYDVRVFHFLMIKRCSWFSSETNGPSVRQYWALVVVAVVLLVFDALDAFGVFGKTPSLPDAPVPTATLRLLFG